MNGEGISAGKLVFNATCTKSLISSDSIYTLRRGTLPDTRKFTLFIGLYALFLRLTHSNFNNRDLNSSFNFELDESITSTLWHSDVSYELQPPGLTTFFLLAQPQTGGDTLFTSQVAALKRLSPQYVAFLRTLKAVHSGVEQAEFSRAGRRGGTVRREPVENIHPVIRKHPVTGEEALYVNRQFTRRIVGLKREESGKYSVVVIPASRQFNLFFVRIDPEILVRSY